MRLSPLDSSSHGLYKTKERRGGGSGHVVTNVADDLWLASSAPTAGDKWAHKARRYD